jgi:hypothetical protein
MDEVRLTRRILMRAELLAGIALVCATTAVAAQTGSKPSSSPQTGESKPAQAGATSKPIKTMTVRGCLRGTGAGADTDLYTLVDGKNSATYRLSGTDMRPHVGHRVQIVGGLVPSANVAAQASAIDPAQAAIAAADQRAARPGSVQPELRVTRVRPLAGVCDPR